MSNGRLFDDETMAAPARDEADADAAASAGEPRLRVANRRQVMLRPVDLESLLAPEHEARALWALLDGMDLADFYARIKARGRTAGRSATDPKILLCLWLYATSQGVGSSRRLAQLCDEHDAYRWICGGVTVNHDMLNDFRAGMGTPLDELLTQLLAVLLQNGLVTLRRVAQDGMRVRASAGAASFRREKTLKRCLVEARRQVAHVKTLADEDSPRSKEKAAQERAAQDRKDRVERALAQLPRVRKMKAKADKDDARVSTTDPDARVMKMGDGGFRPAYNVQLATDVDSRMIVGVSVTNIGSDAGQLLPMLKQVEQRLASPEALLVDGGFVNLRAIDAAETQDVTVYAPVPTPRKEGIDRYERKPTDTDATATWRARMATEDAKEIYKERAATAETSNANLRELRGLNRIVVRGLSKAVTIATLAAFTYNALQAIRLGVLL